MRSNFLLIIFSVIILVFVSLYDLNYVDYRFPIPYGHWREIAWEDFRGLRRPSINVEGSTRIAFIYCGFELEEDHDEFMVTTYFHPSRSYVYSRNTFDKNLFLHEMYHLHITEVCARLLRQRLSDDILSGIDPDVSFLREKFEKEENSMQLQYDFDTNHGYRLGKQKAWQEKIDSSLNVLHKFEKPVIRRNIGTKI